MTAFRRLGRVEFVHQDNLLLGRIGGHLLELQSQCVRSTGPESERLQHPVHYLLGSKPHGMSLNNAAEMRRFPAQTLGSSKLSGRVLSD